MSRAKSFLKYWLPLLIWMGVIFSASSDSRSGHHSSRLIEPVVRWLVPDISDAAVRQVVFFVRKGAHVTEYAILAVLWWRALRRPRRHASRSWHWRQALLALGLSALYAATDEFHQSFVASRVGSGWDVLLDTVGAALGLALVWGFGRWRKYW